MRMQGSLKAINRKLQEANLSPAEVVDEEVAIPSHVSEVMGRTVCKRLGWVLKMNEIKRLFR